MKLNQPDPTTRKQISLNVPQMLFNLIQPSIGVCIWARATGKSEGPVASYIYNCVYKMPGSNGFIQGATYASVEQKIWPAIEVGLNRLGLQRDVHYWVQRKPDPKLRIPSALRDPLDYRHYIKFHNGTGIYLISQDKTSLTNGIRTQWGVVDEAKLINKKEFDAVTVPTMAGGDHLWGTMAPTRLAEYLSILFSTDMPDNSSGKWLFEFEKMMDVDRIKLILETQVEIQKLKALLSNPDIVNAADTLADLNEYERCYNDLRVGSVYYSLANAIDNIGFVGPEFLRNQMQILEETKYRLQILNERIIRDEKGFYFTINPDVNGYPDMIDYSHYNTLSGPPPHVRDCRWDSDIVKSYPLEIALDHNNIINCIVTMQEHKREAYLLSSMWVLKPQMLRDCIFKWHEYYQYHQSGSKDLYYWHDATSVGENAKGDIPFAQEVNRLLTELGWNVIPCYIGQIGAHGSRHHFWELFGSGQNPDLPKFKYNRTNAESWESSALNAGVLKQGGKIKKDKKSERPDSNVHPSEATHLSEAADILFYGKYKEIFASTGSSAMTIG